MSKRVWSWLPGPLLDLLDAYAAENFVTRSQVIVTAVKYFFDAKKVPAAQVTAARKKREEAEKEMKETKAEIASRSPAPPVRHRVGID